MMKPLTRTPQPMSIKPADPSQAPTWPEDQELDARNREAIAQQVLNFGWKESEPSLKEHQFNEEYRSMRWFLSDQVRRDFESAQRHLYCRSCLQTDDKTKNVRAPRLYIAIEPDHLGNSPCIAHLTCYNCSWEVYVNLPRDPRNAAQSDMVDGLRYAMERAKMQQAQQRQQHLATLQDAVAKGLVDPSRVEEMMRKLIEDMTNPPAKYAYAANTLTSIGPIKP